MFNKIIVTILLLFTLTAYAQQKPIKVVIPFGVGGLVDGSNRRLQEALVQELGRPVQIDSRPGAAGYIGLKHVAGVKTDEVLLTIIDSMALSNVILLHDDIALEDFKYIGQLGVSVSTALAVKKGSSLKNLDAWRTQGRSINVGINGHAGAHHYFGWVLETQHNFPIAFVPYKGVNEMLNNLIGGHIDAGWGNLPALEPHVQAGRIEVVAVIGTQRTELMPDVPTFGELGIKTPPGARWLLISNDTTDLVTLKQVEQAMAKLVNDPQFVQIMRTIGIIIQPKSIDQANRSMTTALQQQTKFIEFIKTQRK